MSSSMQYGFEPGVSDNVQTFLRHIFHLLGTVRHIACQEKSTHDVSPDNDSESAPPHLVGRRLRSTDGLDAQNPPRVEFAVSASLQECVGRIGDALRDRSREREAETLQHVLELSGSDVELGGLGIGPALRSTPWPLSARNLDDVAFLVEAWLEALNSADNARPLPAPVTARDPARRPMTLSEKIFAHHATRIPSPAGIKPGDFIRVLVDWVIASELSWVGMKHSLESIGRPPTVWRNDRFWLAGDHVVDPRTYEQPRVRKLMDGMAEAKKRFRMTENQGSNFTILHTEFVRERAEPGMLVVGSDSHTCSAGAVSCLAIGLGAADVMMALATGETWFKVPESIHVRLVNRPAWYIKGKDTILYILKELKRNTVAADRIVEFGGPGARHLSCDARFAITNMCTELGGITGIFAPDEVTHAYIHARARKAHKASSRYFQADPGAQYAETFEIDLAQVESFIALYPSPDNVVPITDKIGMPFDGCFIGACTTTEEELILAALVLQVGLEENLPLVPGKRQVVPGSLPIVRKLTKLGLLEVYERGGFARAAPGCSLCLGMGADRAEPGETWLSSQNRNFKNRMGHGSFGNICSAATVAASSFSMTLTDPRPFLAKVKPSDYTALLETRQASPKMHPAGNPPDSGSRLTFVEPYLACEEPEPHHTTSKVSQNGLAVNPTTPTIQGKAYVLGDFVDTDAIIPASFILASPTDEQLGSHCLEYTNPDFREKVRAGHDIVVAGKAFGCGSSREEAPRALKGLGVKCVIARSFSFIYGRNQPSIGLLGITIADDDFYARVATGVDIAVDVSRRAVVVAGRHRYPVAFDDMELRLMESRGLAGAFLKYGRRVFQNLCAESPATRTDEAEEKEEWDSAKAQLAW